VCRASNLERRSSCHACPARLACRAPFAPKRAFLPTCLRLTGYGSILYTYPISDQLCSILSIEHTREEAVPTFLSSGRWIEEGNSYLGSGFIVNHKEAVI
jgi:hypothetical protein